MSSSGVYGGDEVGAIVIDIGSHTIRGGFAGEDMPKADFPTVAGVGAVLQSSADMCVGGDGAVKQCKYYIDTVNIKVPREDVDITNFLSDGLVEDWDLFEKVVDYVYTRQLRSSPDSHPLLMSEPAWNVRSKRERLTELMFEKYKVPAFYLAKNAVLSAFSHGRSTGLILDSGAVHTTAVPVYDGFVIQQGVVRSSLGGDSVLAECRKLLGDLGVDIVPQYLVAQKEAVGEGEGARWKPRESLPPITPSFHTFSQQELLRDFAASVVQVSDGPYEEEAETIEATPPVCYEMPTGYNQRFGAERFRIGESLFDPSYIRASAVSPTAVGMGQVVTASIGLCDIDIRPSLFNSVMIVGGNSLVNGFSDRLNVDLSNRIPPSMKLKVISSPVNAERRFSSWIGGSILASLGSFQQLWLSRQEYEESGKGCIERKCP